MVEYLPEMRDAEGATLLSRAAQENNYKIFDCLVFVFKQRISQKMKKTLPNNVEKDQINAIKR
jgi:hypothetical protein